MNSGCPAKSRNRSKPARWLCPRPSARRCQSEFVSLNVACGAAFEYLRTGMALQLDIFHEQIAERRQRQRDPLKIGTMILGALCAFLVLSIC